MLKKLLMNFSIILSIFFFIQISIFAGSENATNIIIDYEGFCPNYPVEFLLYNQTQFDDKDDIKDDLCEEDENPKDDRCEEWEDFTGTVFIHNGPIKGMTILQEIELKNQRSFEINFPVVNDYLIRYESKQEDKYNDFDETVTIFECKFSENNKDTSTDTTEDTAQTEIQTKNNNDNKDTKTDNTFLYQNNKVVLDIKDSTYTDESQITYNENLDSKLNNSLKTFELISKDETKEFSSMSIQMNINLKNKIFEIYKENENTKEWEIINLKIIEQTKTSLTFELETFGKYSIVEIIEKSTIVKNEDENKNVESEVPKEIDTTLTTLDLEKSNTSLFSPSLIIGSIVFVLLIAGFIFMPKKRKEIDMTNYQNSTSTPINQETYNKTKEYVHKYKEKYNKEQIRTSLTTAKVDTAVIDKVLNEEFTQ